jgi:ribonuclease BN (tRNA processing enzyme)
MRLTCAGTGTAAPEADRACSGYLVEHGPIRLLLDCGGGVVHSLARLGLAWQEITHLAITHFHNDHIGDVPLLFFAWKHGMRPGRSQPLVVVGPRGTRRLLRRLARTFGDHVKDPGFPVQVVELEPGAELRLGDEVRLRAAKTHHTTESLAFRVEAAGRSLCYTGDTGPSQAVGIFAQAADALLVECSVPDDDAMDTHLTPSQVADMARVALPGRILVTHVYPQLDRAAIPALVREAGWGGDVAAVADGETFEF